MAMEKPGYRDVLERIRNESSGELVTVAEAAKITGYSKAKVTQKFDGWQQFGRGKRIPATALARQLC